MDFTVYKKRYGAEYLGITEFITPSTPKVLDLILNNQLPDGVDPVWFWWDWCCRHITYPPFQHELQSDFHQQMKFFKGWSLMITPLKKSTNHDDFWQFPFETLDPPCYGDCKDKSFALMSILLNYMPSGSVQCVVGRLFGAGHAWVDVVKDGRFYVLDSTLPKACDCGAYGFEEKEPYEPLIKFDNQGVIDVNEGYTLYLNEPEADDYARKYPELLALYKSMM